MADGRYIDDPLVVGAAQVRAYIGAPVFAADGAVRGAISAFDVNPRVFDASATGLVIDLARIVAEALDSDRLLEDSQLAVARGIEREQILQDTFEHAAVGIIHTSPDGRWLRVNQRVCAMLGYSNAELTSRTALEFIHPDNAASSVSSLSSVACKRSATSEPLVFFGVIEDISSRKRSAN